MQTIKFLDEKTVKLTTNKSSFILEKYPYTKIYDKTEKKYVSLSIPFYTINGDTYV